VVRWRLGSAEQFGVDFYKRLERGTFAVPPEGDASRQLRREELVLMLEGIDQVTTRKRLRYSLPKELIRD